MMYVWRPGESSTPRVITIPRAEIFIELRLPRPVPQGARGPRRTDKAAACAGKHARRQALLQRQLYRWAALRPAAPAMRSKLVETSQGVRGMSQRNSTAQRLVFARQHARQAAG